MSPAPEVELPVEQEMAMSDSEPEKIDSSVSAGQTLDLIEAESSESLATSLNPTPRAEISAPETPPPINGAHVRLSCGDEGGRECCEANYS